MVAALTFPYTPTTELLHKWGGVITMVHGIVVQRETPRGGHSRDAWWFDCDVRWTDGGPPGHCPVEPFKLAAEDGGENSDIRALCAAMNDYLAAHGTWCERGPHRGWYAHRDEVFSIRAGEWQVRLGGDVLPTIWNSKGAALAGLEVERRRRIARMEGRST